MSKNPQLDKKHILVDPVAAYQRLHTQATPTQLKTLSELHHEHTKLQQQHQKTQRQTQRLSREIGAAKRAGKPLDTPLAAMQAHSKDLKALAVTLKQTTEKILDYFVEDTSTTPAPLTDTLQPIPARYTAEAAPEQAPKIIQLNQETDAWNTYVAKHPASSMYHRAEWRNLVKQTFGHECPYFMALDQNQRVTGVLPLVQLSSRLFGNFMVSMPYFNYGGALADHPLIEQRLMEAANAYAEHAGIQHIEYRDTLPRKGLPVRSKKVCMLLQLPNCHDALWQRFSPKLRAQIKRPQREHPEVRSGSLECLDDFYAVFSRNMRDLGTPVYGKSFFANILKAFPQQSTILSVRLGGKPVAAAFLLGHKEQLEIPWASAIKEVNHLSMNMLLYWEVLKTAIDQHYQRFDFGRSSLDSGTFRFKQQWGAEPLPLYWHYWLQNHAELPELNPDNPKYALAITLWKRLPLFVSNRIGPVLVKYLP